MLNPLRSEQEAFRFLIYVAVDRGADRGPRAAAPGGPLIDDLALAERAARRAGEVLLGYFGRPPEGLDTKSSRTDPVSDADREAERAIGELLAAERPDDGLLAEEGTRSEAHSGRRWIVDPLDGTVNFLYGFPVWGVSVALEDEEGVAVGVVYDPCRDELFRATRGGGAELDGRPLRVRERRELRAALVATGFSYDPARRGAQAELVAALVPQVRDIRRAGAAALDLAWLAAGQARRLLRARPEALGLGGGPPARGGGRRRLGAPPRRPAGPGRGGHPRGAGRARGARGRAGPARETPLLAQQIRGPSASSCFSVSLPS